MTRRLKMRELPLVFPPIETYQGSAFVLGFLCCQFFEASCMSLFLLELFMTKAIEYFILTFAMIKLSELGFPSQCSYNTLNCR